MRAKTPAEPLGLHETADGVAYREALSPWARGFVLAMAAAMLVLPAVFVRHAAIAGPASIAAAVLLVLAPFALGLVFLRMGLASIKRIVFDRRHRLLRIDRRGPVAGWGRRADAIAFDDVTAVTVERRKGLEDGDSFVLRLDVAGRQPIVLGMLGEAEAQRWCERLRVLLR